MREAKAAIQFHDVSYAANETSILKSITGSFPEGLITTIVGPSGGGKTTLIKLCNGLLSRSTGKIEIKGKSMDAYHPVELRRMIGISLQSTTMIPGSVGKNLELPLGLRGSSLSKYEAKQILIKVGLDETLLHRNVKDLSGGQRQKLSVARTLVNQPDVLLLDEVTSSLDQVSKQDMEELIVSINREQETTIIWITHNLEQATAIGDYTWVMIDGKLMETGESGFLHEPTNEQVKRFVKGEVE